MKVIVDFHHTQLYFSFAQLIEKRLKGKLYRPGGQDWWDRGYYWHPLEEEGRGNLNPFGEDRVEVASPEQFWEQDKNLYRFLSLDEVKDIDVIICSSDRVENQWAKLRKDFGLKCPIIRYIGNRNENVDMANFDFMIPATMRYYHSYVENGRRPGFLYHPEIRQDLYFPRTEKEKPILRTFLNFIWHDAPGSDQGLWERYKNWANEDNVYNYTHGLGTPPPGVPAEKNKVLETFFRENQEYQQFLDRANWPDPMVNDGEPPNEYVLSKLIQAGTTHAFHYKTCDGYGFIIHSLGMCGVIPIVGESNYSDLSAGKWLIPNKTCLFITSNIDADRGNFKRSLQKDVYDEMRDNLIVEFNKHVNFNEEEQEFRKLLNL